MNREITNIVITSAFHPVEGGIETYMYQVAKNWAHGESVVFTLGVTPDALGADLPFPLHLRPTESGSYLLNLIRLMRRVRFHPGISLLLAMNRDFVRGSARRLLHLLGELQNRKDFILQASTAIPNGFMGVIANRVLGGKLVVYIHGSEILRFKKKLNNRLLLGYVIARADRIVANSRFTATLISDLPRKPDSLRIVNIGADTSRFFPTDSRARIIQELKIPSDAFLFMTLGRLIRRKGHDNVLKAMAALVKKYSDIFYVIVGRGPEEKRLKELAARLNISDKVRFVGFVDHERMNDYLNACDCFIMANRQEDGDVEGYGLVFIEAGACRKPVIAGRSGGAVDAVVHNETGILTDPLRPDEIAGAMEAVMNDPKLAARLADNGFRRATGPLNWKNVCSTINAQVLEVLTENSIDPS